jgi:hypothetical protein
VSPPSASPPSESGAAVLRIGVTGHRDLGDVDTAERAVDGVIDDLVTSRPDGTALELRSALAEGADRLVAERVLARDGSRLVAVLPLGADDYRRDFLTPTSLDHFERLLDQADAVEVPLRDAAGSREAAYERAGRAMVDASDVLIALWDGEPSRGRGGTAEIIDYARSKGRQVIVVPVVRAPATRSGGM